MNVVSIIIPCYNNEAFLKESIASALNQTYKHVEVIVVDDGSTDRSLDIIRSFGDKIRWETQTNQGAPIARNQGIELATGEYIKFLDADDILFPDCIERQLSQALQIPVRKKAVVYGDTERINRQGRHLPSHILRPKRIDEDPIAHILSQCPLTSCPLHKREYLMEVNGFDPAIPRGQEHDLHLRLVLAGVAFMYHAGYVYQYREYSDERRISNNRFSKKGVMIPYQVLQRHQQLIEEQTGAELTSSVRRILAQRFWAFGRSILREGFSTEADQYFAAARQLNTQNCITGRFPYHTLVNLFGPQKAESLMQRLKKIFKQPSAW